MLFKKIETITIIETVHIGTLVVNKEKDLFKIIDGKQRTTALNLIALALKHEFGFDRLKAVNLTFQLGRNQMRIFKSYLPKQKISEGDENELTRGYEYAKDALKKSARGASANPQSFVDYLFENVIIFRSILPEDLDLNLYFERFNSRGEQLEAHEILKAQMMSKFGEDQEMAQKFCENLGCLCRVLISRSSTHLQKAKEKHHDGEREKSFL